MNDGAPLVETEQSIQEEFVEALLGSSQATTEIREKQLDVLIRVPDSIVDDIYQDLLDRAEDNKHFRNPQIETEDDLMSFIRGSLFETLVKIDIYTRLKKSPAEQAVAEEALDLFQHPDRYGLDNRLRNPDLTIVNTKTQKIVGAVDAKLGLLNWRAFEQARKFEENMVTILDKVKARKRQFKPRYEGETFAQVYGISDKVLALSVAQEFKRIFVLPRDRSIEKDELVTYEDADGRRLSNKQRALLDSKFVDPNIKFAFSHFSQNEVTALAKVVREKFRTQYDLELLN